MQITATEPRTKVQGRRSHFAFKNWVYGADGKRLGAVPVRPVTSAAADLVSTCYTNPGKGTKTVYCLQWDLDAHRADTHLLDKRGCLKSAVILKTLRAEQPELMRHIFAVTRSTSGKGLSVAIPISPLELVPATERAQRAARALQKKVLELFNHYGFGADPGALGLDRDFANWHNQTRTVRYVRPLLDAVQSDRTPVVRRLLRVLNHCPQLAYKKKKERSGLLYPDLRAERKLALLYLAALEGDGWSQKVIAEVIADTHLTDLIADTHLTTREIAQSTGLSLSFLQKFLHAPPPWLKAEWLGKHEGWRLTVRFAKDLSVRALELCPQSYLNHSREISPLRCISPRLRSGSCRSGRDDKEPCIIRPDEFRGRDDKGPCNIQRYAVPKYCHLDRSGMTPSLSEGECSAVERSPSSDSENGELKFPQEVEDGERNAWIVQALLLLKFNGTPAEQALELMREHLRWVSANETSRNVRQIAMIVRSIYRNHRGSFGSKPGCAPAWLLGGQIGGVKNKKQSSFKKGSKTPGVIKRKVSADGCFIFERNYYSLPREFIGEKITVFPWERQLRVYEDERLIFTHKIVEGRGQYTISAEHRLSMNEILEHYFARSISRLARYGPKVKQQAEDAVNRHGVYALRRLWALRGACCSRRAVDKTSKVQ